ncbi:hypothetical protein [Brevibacillus sp. DP1.3A]|uniref:hypothetical protein n=1 Tax=Brevibacillus sp. DP1.3A TaxID=2738867 RepID=UPI00156AB0FF|nr:hypothetical protein [Brevibacillus sp. DP1.3A]UED74908.1 hypothetical protein HP399_030220 [Brevibacillus sp. DP1.3A]
MLTPKKTQDVFGLSNTILNDSYIDRGNLDIEVQRYLGRPTHIALRGESKCGKSWFRQKNIPNSIVIQCRYGKSIIDIYTDALAQLGIKLTIEQSKGSNLRGQIEAQTSFGAGILSKLGLKASFGSDKSDSIKEKPVGQDINDLKFIAEIIIFSERRLVIEDFHYLSTEERKKFSYDLKALWDYGCFVIIIGVWSQNNLLTYLNPDLTGRIVELSIYWSTEDLKAVIVKGSKALNIKFTNKIETNIIDNCFGNVGILQKLLLLTLDKARVFEGYTECIEIQDYDFFMSAASKYADDLNATYQQFARRVSAGIRKRKDSTGIYAHAMAIIVDAYDEKLINGLDLNEIYQIAHNREPRIQKNNLRVVLNKLEELQVDEDGRGLVIAFNDSNDEITAVDRQLLFYRRHLSVKWPWEALLSEMDDRLNGDKIFSSKKNPDNKKKNETEQMNIFDFI